MTRRRLVTALTVVAVFVLVCSVALGAVLTWWVPTRGKARLIELLERPGTLQVSIGTMRYRLFRGVQLEQVRVVTRASQELWLSAPHAQVGIGWPALLFLQRLAFHAEASIDVPCRTTLTVSGYYHRVSRAIAVTVRTADIPRADIAPPLAPLVPPALAGGTFRLTLHYLFAPQRAPSLSGQLIGRQLSWQTPALRMTGDVTYDGSVIPPPQKDSPWRWEGRITWRHGAVKTLRFPLELAQVEADARIAEHRLTVDRLTGRALDSDWTMAGTVDWSTPTPAVEALVSSSVELASVAAAFPYLAEHWNPSGHPALRAVCRGPLKPSPALDCLLHTEFRDLRLGGPAWPGPITDLSGSLDYDVVAKRLTVTRLEGVVRQERLSGRGEAVWSPSPPNSAHVAGTLGFSNGTLTVEGRLSPEAFAMEEGRIELPHSQLRLRGAVSRTAERPSRLRLDGAVELSELRTLPFVSLPWAAAWNLDGPVEVRADVHGRLADWPGTDVRAQLRAARVRVRDVPIEQLTCTMEQGGGLLQLRIPAATIADGKFWAALDLHHRAGAPEYVLEADLLGLQFARLSQLIPAWRSRSPVGSGSAHGLLSGVWGQRPSWRGEGWVNATGERLGDVPLLDTVFRGIFGVLADRLGLDVLRRAQITHASFRWRVSQERVITDDFRLGGMAGEELVAVYARGSVGLDQTLDFVVEPELSEGVLLHAPTTATLAGTVLKAAGQLDRLRRLIGRHRLTGTLTDPEFRFEFSTQELFRQLAPSPADFLQNLLDRVR